MLNYLEVSISLWRWSHSLRSLQLLTFFARTAHNEQSFMFKFRNCQKRNFILFKFALKLFTKGRQGIGATISKPDAVLTFWLFWRTKVWLFVGNGRSWFCVQIHWRNNNRFLAESTLTYNTSLSFWCFIIFKTCFRVIEKHKGWQFRWISKQFKVTREPSRFKLNIMKRQPGLLFTGEFVSTRLLKSLVEQPESQMVCLSFLSFISIERQRRSNFTVTCLINSFSVKSIPFLKEVPLY